MTNDANPYADMLHLPHHQSAAHPPMSLMNRAAQFSPFAALVGFDGVIAETGRLTERRIELSESEQEALDRRLAALSEALREGDRPVITVRYFVPDAKKDGGVYQEHTGPVRSVDPAERRLVFLAENGLSAGLSVPMDDILDIRGETVDDAPFQW